MPHQSDIGYADKKLRFERKFVFTDFEYYHLHKLIMLNRAGFFEKYPMRQVNNIYFDTPNFDSYSASVRGYSQRRKFRIRWYGNMFGKINDARLEIKAKERFVNYKSSYKLGYLDLSNGANNFDNVNKALENSQIPVNLLAFIKTLKPVLMNQYVRKYYESMNENIRLTLDWNLMFYGMNRFQNFYLNKTSKGEISILELKYNNDEDCIVNYITNQFPFRLTKSSKYVLGINRVFLFSDLS